MGPPDCWVRLPTPSFYQKANPEEEAKSRSLSFFSSSSSLFDVLLRPPLSTSTHLASLAQPILILLLIPPPPAMPPSPPPPSPPARLAPSPLRSPAPPPSFHLQVTLYLLPLVGSGACPYRVCYYYLTLSIIPKRAGSPLRDCDSPRD